MDALRAMTDLHETSHFQGKPKRGHISVRGTVRYVIQKNTEFKLFHHCTVLIRIICCIFFMFPIANPIAQSISHWPVSIHHVVIFCQFVLRFWRQSMLLTLSNGVVKDEK